MDDNDSTLSQITSGGEVLSALARGRLAEAMDALEHGDYQAAWERCQEAVAKISPLAAAQGAIASMAGHMVIRAANIQRGMLLYGAPGEVAEVEHAETACPRGHRHPAVHITFEGGEEASYTPDSELLLATTPRS